MEVPLIKPYNQYRSSSAGIPHKVVWDELVYRLLKLFTEEDTACPGAVMSGFTLPSAVGPLEEKEAISYNTAEL